MSTDSPAYQEEASSERPTYTWPGNADGLELDVFQPLFTFTHPIREPTELVHLLCRGESLGGDRVIGGRTGRPRGTGLRSSPNGNLFAGRRSHGLQEILAADPKKGTRARRTIWRRQSLTTKFMRPQSKTARFGLHQLYRPLRGKVGLSQDEFARTFGVSVGTLRNWEQKRVRPDGPARVLLTVIDRDPVSVLKALRIGPKGVTAKRRRAA